MALDDTASEVNIFNSIRKYLVDSLETAEGKELSFDISLNDPDLHDATTTEWVTVNLGKMNRFGMAQLLLDIYCCTRSDNEGDNNAALVDLVVGYMTDNTKPDGKRRITIYNQSDVEVGVMFVQDIIEGARSPAPDGTKYKVLSCRLRWVAKI